MSSSAFFYSLEVSFASLQFFRGEASEVVMLKEYGKICGESSSLSHFLPQDALKKKYPKAFDAALKARKNPASVSASTFQDGQIFRNVAAFVMAAVLKHETVSRDDLDAFWQGKFDIVEADAGNAGEQLCAGEEEALALPGDLAHLEMDIVPVMCKALYEGFRKGNMDSQDKLVEFFLVGN